MLFHEMIFLQGLEELLYIILGTVTANPEPSNDLTDDLWLGGTTFKKLKDS